MMGQMELDALKDLSNAIWDVSSQLKGIRQELRLARRYPLRLCPACGGVIPTGWDNCLKCGYIGFGSPLKVKDLAKDGPQDGDAHV